MSRVSFAILALFAIGTSRPAYADDPLRVPIRAEKKHRLEWDEHWERFRPVEYVATGAIDIGALGVLYFASSSNHAKWGGPILFDEPLRNFLRLRSPDALTTVRNLSYVTAFVPVVQEAALDSILLPAIDKNFDVLWQMSMMNAQAYGFSTLITVSLYDTIGRARPSYDECKAGTSNDPLCNSGRFADFPSGHMSTAMTAAGLLCAHHTHLDLYGGGLPDSLACVEGLTLGAATGVLRMMGDRHYFSDVFVGGGIGFFAGYALPMLLHYWKTERPLGEMLNRPEIQMAMTLGNQTTPLGAGIRGRF